MLTATGIIVKYAIVFIIGIYFGRKSIKVKNQDEQTKQLIKNIMEGERRFGNLKDALRFAKTGNIYYYCDAQQTENVKDKCSKQCEYCEKGLYE